MDKREFSTQAVRAGQVRSQFQEHAEALFLTSSFVFDSAAQAQARFSGGDPGVVYSRYTNPTVSMLQDRLAALEGAQACIATASGMSAILASAMSLLRSGDHVVCSSAVFGATVQLFSNYFARFGVETTFVSPPGGPGRTIGGCVCAKPMGGANVASVAANDSKKSNSRFMYRPPRVS